MAGIPRILKRLPADVLRLKRRGTAPGRPPKGHVDLYADENGLLAGVGDTGAAISVGGVDAHLADTADAHDASAISFSPAGSVAATDVQAAIVEVDGDVTAHVGDTTAAHAATAIAFTPAGSIAATTVQAAIEEVAAEAGGGGTVDLDVTETVTFSGILTPASFNSQQDDYNPAGLADATILRLEGTGGNQLLTGLAGGADGRRIEIHNIGDTRIRFPHDSASSTAGNRFLLPLGDAGDVAEAELALRPRGKAILSYDGTSSRWRVHIGIQSHNHDTPLEGDQLYPEDIEVNNSLIVHDIFHIDEGGDDSTPPANKVALYAKSDGLLYSKDDAGAETALGGGGGGSVATDAIWDAAGDLAVGTGANTAAKLTVGSEGQVPRSNGTTLAYAGSMTRLAESVLGADAADITFSSISGAYRNLLLVVHGRGASAAAGYAFHAQVNADTGSNSDWSRFYTTEAANATEGSEGTTNLKIGYIPAAGATANRAGMVELWFPGYAGTTFHKQILGNCSTNDGGNIIRDMMAGTWRSTSAITSIKVFLATGNLLAGTVATLYGGS
jgi:hypothetical protein